MSLTYRYLAIPFANPFADERVSHEDFYQFSFDVKGSLRVNRLLLGISQAQEEAYNSALTEYQKLRSSEGSARGDGKSSTLSSQLAYNAFVSEVRRKEGLVKSVYAKKSAGYQAIFPRGLAPYQATAKGDQLTEIIALVKQFSRFEDQFPGAAATLDALREAFEEALTNQADKKGALKGSKSARDLARLNLAGNHREIWLTVALKNPGKPEMVKVLYNVSIFNKGTNYDKDKLGRVWMLVLDAEGNHLKNMQVKIRDLEGKVKAKGRTKKDGQFKSRSLKIGFYEVKVSGTGFEAHLLRWEVLDEGDVLGEVRLERASEGG